MDLRLSGPTLLLALICLLSLMGCGGPARSRPPDYAKALRGAPAPLVHLYSQGNELIPGGEGEFERRLRPLRGYPVVANLWASWCGNCRVEFSFLQKLSARYGTRVAFLGIDSEDSNDAAETWLKEAPVPYPSITDPDRQVANSLKVLGFPSTAFYNRQGSLVFLKQGAYRDSSELEDQIKELLAEG